MGLYRNKLAVVAACCSGLLFALIFFVLVAVLQNSETETINRAAIVGFQQAKQEVVEQPRSPDLGEVAASNPGLSLALFDQTGRLLAKKGPLDLGLKSGGNHNLVQIHGPVSGSREIWIGMSLLPAHERIARLSMFLTIIWFPLTSIVAAAVWMAAKWTFAPLAAMAGQAARLDDHDLAKRPKFQYGGEYSQFADQLNALLDRIEESVSRQEQFVYDAAHELRTPLTIISGLIQVQLKKKDLNRDDYEMFGSLYGETERLSTLTEMLLQSARTKNNLSGGVGEVSAAAEASAARWLDRFTARGICLEVNTEECWVKLSTAELEVVLDNLLSNAFRAMSKGGEVTISTCCKEGTAEIAVADNGPGFPSEMNTSVFERFVRADDGRNRESGGFGLGLSISKRLIEDAGGAIVASSEPGKGALFTISLPLASEPN